MSVVGRPGLDAKDKVAYILDFVFVEVWDAVYDCPWNRAAKINDLVHDEGHDSGSEDIVLQICIPSCPQALQKIKVDVVFGDLIELAPVSVGRGGKEGRC